MIISGGINVFPKEVEDVVDATGLVRECAVIGKKYFCLMFALSRCGWHLCFVFRDVFLRLWHIKKFNLFLHQTLDCIIV